MTAPKAATQGGQLLACDRMNTVNRLQSAPDLAHTPHGFRSPASALNPTLGFNGQRLEQDGGYLLGHGYRNYNPQLMRFSSPDSFSPFGAGGLNAYAYCEGDPVNYSDPSGHRREENEGATVMTILGAGLMALGVMSAIIGRRFGPSHGVAIGAGGVAVGVGIYGMGNPDQSILGEGGTTLAGALALGVGVGALGWGAVKGLKGLGRNVKGPATPAPRRGLTRTRVSATPPGTPRIQGFEMGLTNSNLNGEYFKKGGMFINLHSGPKVTAPQRTSPVVTGQGWPTAAANLTRRGRSSSLPTGIGRNDSIGNAAYRSQHMRLAQLRT